MNSGWFDFKGFPRKVAEPPLCNRKNRDPGLQETARTGILSADVPRLKMALI